MPQDNTQQPVQDDTNTMPVADVTPSGNPVPAADQPMNPIPAEPAASIPTESTVTEASVTGTAPVAEPAEGTATTETPVGTPAA